VEIQNTTAISPLNAYIDPRDVRLDAGTKINKVSSAGEMQNLEDTKLKEACREFESFFLYQLMKEMRKTVNETNFLKGGHGEEVFRDMLDEEMTKEMAKSPSGGIGIANMMYQQLARPKTASEPMQAPFAAPAPAQAPAADVQKDDVIRPMPTGLPRFDLIPALPDRPDKKS
jgi:Rod binding domain-containing protein